ncbi:MAG: hypothetical protein IJS78_02445 [Clostridia bacterium]|nr:hypothetical protein [Clostridia bacterium]
MKNKDKLREFRYSPGYCDMRGASRSETLRKNGAGEWEITTRRREVWDEPTAVSSYAVTAEDAARFEAFIAEKNVLSLVRRRDSGDFATDYSPWSYEFVFEGSPAKFFRIEEYKKYSERDYALLRELDALFASIRGELISETTEGK